MSWKKIDLIDACELITDGTHYTPKDIGTGIPFLTVRDMDSDKGLDFLNCSFISSIDFKQAAQGNSAPILGDVLFSKDGTVGKVHVVTTNNEFAVLSSIAILRPNKNILDAGYLGLALKSPAMLNDALSRKTGSAIRRIVLSDLKKVKIPLPPLPEQKRIAAILDKADEIRRKREAAIAKLDQLAQSIFVEMFGNPIENENGWRNEYLKNVVQEKYGIKAGPFGSSLKKEEYVATGYRVYGQEQVIAGSFEVGDYYITEEKFSQLRSCAINEGDVLVSLVGSFGKILVVPEGTHPGIINPRLLKISPDRKKLNPSFLAALLQNRNVQHQFSLQAHGGIMGVLNAGLLKELKVIIPPIGLQERFINRVKKVDQLKANNIAALARQNHLFTTLQHQAFTGAL